MIQSKHKKWVILATVIALSAIVVGSAVGVAYSVWIQNSDVDQTLDVPIDEYNPSEKYIKFRGLDEDGNFADVSSKEIVAYAAVGYDGLVAEVVIPATHDSKPVTRVCTAENELYQYRFRANPVITSISIPASVTQIDASAFADMLLLAKVTLLGGADSPAVTIGDFAFANCHNLTQFTCARPIVGERDSYLAATPAYA